MLKGLKSLTVCILIVGVLMCAHTAFADGDIKVVVDGRLLTFDVSPTTIQGRTMVPMRAIFEALGAKVEWDGSTKTITGTKEQKKIVLKLGSNQATVNGEQRTLDVAAMEINGRTMVPLRFISESLGISIRWDNNTHTAKIDTNILFGKMVSKDQSTWYEGEIQNQMPNGYGKEYYAETGGVMYEGEWKDGKRFGNGKTYGGWLPNSGKVVLESEGEFDGDLVRGKAYYANGVVCLEKNLSSGSNGYNGEVKRYYQDGKILMIAEVKDNQATLSTKYYDKNGNVLYEGEAALKVTAKMLHDLIYGESN